MPMRHEVVLDRFGGPNVMKWARRAVPRRLTGEVRVEVEAIGVNFGDTIVRRGQYRRNQSLSFTPGFEAVGRVSECDPDDAALLGRRVVVFLEHGRGYADTIISPRDRVYPIGDEVPAVVAAALFIQGTTAWYALHRFGGVVAGDVVLVHAAAGGVGSMAVQLATAAGAVVVATASTEYKRDLAIRLGADVALPSEADTLTAAVREYTGGRGVDIVVDGVNGPLLAPSLSALAFGGRYVVTGASSQEPGWMDTRKLMPRAQTIAGFVTGRIIERDAREPRRALDAVLAAYASNALQPQIRVFHADEIVKAHEQLESPDHTGSLVLDLQQERLDETA